MPEQQERITESLGDRITEYYERLTSTEKRVANYIVANESEIVWCSVSTLAEKIRTSEAAIIRTCKKLGYRGFQDFKINVALSLLHPHREKEPGRELPVIGNAEDRELLGNLYEMHTKCLDKAYARVDFEEMKRMADRIVGAESVYLFAVGAAKTVATDVNHKLLRMGKHTYLTHDDREQDMIASMVTDKSVIWAFSFFGGKECFYDKLLTAKENGATIVSLVNNENSSMARISDHVLIGTSDWLSSFLGTTDRLSQFVVVDIFFTYLLHLGYPEAEAAMRRTHSVIERVVRVE